MRTRTLLLVMTSKTTLYTTYERSLDSNKNIRITYLNVRGLDKKKIDWAIQMTSSTSHEGLGGHIVLLAETWFTNHNTITTYPQYITSSVRSQKHFHATREKNGIVALASENLQAHTCIHSTSEFHITLQVFDMIISGVYLPYGMQDDEFDKLIKQIPHSNIILGDFNACLSPNNVPKHIRDKSTSMASTMNSRNMRILPLTSSKYDHIWVNVNTRADMAVSTSCDTLRQTFSVLTDHPSIACTIHLTSATEAMIETTRTLLIEHPTIRYHLKPLQEERIQQLLVQDFDERVLELITLIRNVGDGARKMEEALHEEERVKIRQELVNMIDEMFLYTVEESCKNILGTYEVKAMKMKKDTLASDLASSSSRLSAIRMFKRAQRGRQVRISPLKSGGNVIKDSIDLFEAIYDSNVHYNTTLPLPSTLTSPLPLPDSPLTASFDTGNIKQVIAQYPKYKSCGPDSIHTIIYSTLSESEYFLDVVKSLFVFCLKLGVTPSRWNISNTVLLPKEGGGEITAAKTRPVSLTVMLRRYFEILLFKNISSSPWATLHPSQAGFRRRNSPVLHLMLAHDFCKWQKSKTMVFLDITKAFDRVTHQSILSTLERKGCPHDIMCILSSLLLKNCKSHLIIGEARTISIDRHRGVFQGSVLGPFIFNLVIDNLLHDVDTLVPRSMFPPMLLFADDILITLPRNVGQAQSLLDACDDWAQRCGLTFGLSKCGSIGLNDQENLFIKGVAIPRVNSYRYLGIPFNENGIMWENFITDSSTKASNTLAYLRHIEIAQWPHILKLDIVKTFVVSQVTYLMGLVGHYIHNQSTEQQQALSRPYDMLHKECLHFIFGQTRSIKVLESMSNLPCPSTRLSHAAARLAEHIHRSDPHHPLHTTSMNLLQDHRSWLWAKSQALIYRCKHHPLYDQWYLSLLSIPLEDQPTLKSFLRKRLLTEWNSQPLSRLISQSCRTDGLMDNCLLLSDARVRLLAIAWRTNNLLYNGYCSLCCGVARRDHIEQCVDLREEMPAGFSEMWREYLSDTPGRPCNTTFLDFLLNNQHYHLFSAVIVKLSEHIEGLRSM